MLEILFLTLAFTTAFANSAFGDQDFSPYLENPSSLISSADLGEIPSYETSTNPDQNLFLDFHANGEEYPNLEPQLNAVRVDSNDALLLADLGSSSEPFNLLDPFGFDNKAGPPEPNTAAPPDFLIPDCGARYLLCCSGKPFGAGLYSKCSRCMFFHFLD